MTKFILHIFALPLCACLIVDPSLATTISDQGQATSSFIRQPTFSTQFLQEALSERPRFSGLQVISSGIENGLRTLFRRTELPIAQNSEINLGRRRIIHWLAGVATIVAAFPRNIFSQQMNVKETIPAPVVQHFEGVSRYIAQNINSSTFLESSHPGEPRLANWSYTYDNAMRIMAHLQAGQIDLARKSMDYFLTNDAIQHDGWFWNAIDAAETRKGGKGLELIAHVGPNAYLGIAAIHLYETTKDHKYLEFARARWKTIKTLQNENQDDFNFGAVRMGPRGDTDKPNQQHLDFKLDEPSWYDFYNAEQNADFKALSDLLYSADTTASDRSDYKRASDLIAGWDKKIFDPTTNLFFWGTTEKPYHDDNFDVDVPAGIVPFHPLDATVLKISAYGLNGLDGLLGVGSAERIRSSIDDLFKHTVQVVTPDGSQKEVSGYDFVSNEERQRMVLYVEEGPHGDQKVSHGKGRDPFVSDEWSTWVALADLRLANDFSENGDTDKSKSYLQSFRSNAWEEALTSGIALPDGIAYPYAQPIPYSYNKSIGWGWITAHSGYSLTGGTVRMLGAFMSDPFLPGFGPSAIPTTLQPVQLNRSTTRRSTEQALFTQPEDYVNAAWKALSANQPVQATQWISQMRDEHPSWADEAIAQEKIAANSSAPYPKYTPKTEADIYSKYGMLYYFGTGEFILVKAYMNLKDRPQALAAAIRLLQNYEHSQTFDTRGFFWQPAKSLATEYPDLYRDAHKELQGKVQPAKFDRRNFLTFFRQSKLTAIALLVIFGTAIASAAPLSGGTSAVTHTLAQSLSQIGNFQSIGAVSTLASAVLIRTGLRHQIGVVQRVKSHLSRISVRPGLFFGIILASTLISEFFNFFIYLTSPPSGDPHTYLAKQIFLLTIGIFYVMRFWHLIFSSIWMIVVPPLPPPVPFQFSEPTLPMITVQIPIRGEPFDVVKTTLDSALAISYPKERIEIQVIDNSDRFEQYAEIKAYAESHGVFFIHREGTRGFKARNLNVGMQQAHGNYFLVLDADSTVEPDVLLKVMPEFARDSKLGYVQLKINTTNEETNGITKVITIGMRAYHRMYEINNSQGFIKFDGHNGIMSRDALAAVKGWREEVSEDLATCIQIKLAGFTSKYIPYVETGEDAPTTFQELKKQQRKWAFGTNKIMMEQTKAILTSKHLRWFEKVDILFQMGTYLATAVSFVLIFAYIQFPLAAGILILLSPFVPIISANIKRESQSLFKEFTIATVVFSALIPTVFLGNLMYFIGRKEGFRTTFKGRITTLSFKDIIRQNLLGILGGLSFFIILPIVYPDIPAYLHQLPPSAIAMTSILLGPFLLNYSKKLGGVAAEAHKSRFKILTNLPKLVLPILLTFLTPQFDRKDVLFAYGQIGMNEKDNLISETISQESIHYSSVVNQQQSLRWELKKPAFIHKGQRILIDYKLKGSDVLGIQLKPIGESLDVKGDMIVVHKVNDSPIMIEVPSDILLGEIVIHDGPYAYDWLGGSMAAKLSVDSIYIMPPLPSNTPSVKNALSPHSLQTSA
jgi:cellulose synthase/poly-beta-1,6-N-acetylglucosamine synthase-like glycosyltransferase